MKPHSLLCCMALLLSFCACSADPMESCVKEGLKKALPGDSADRGAYIKAREQVRIACEQRLRG
jgi:hypothetical protein